MIPVPQDTANAAYPIKQVKTWAIMTVTRESGDKGCNCGAEVRRQRSICHTSKSEWNSKCPNDFVFIYELNNKIEESNGPGKKHQGFIHI